ncbi:MAG: hypothetical protein H7Y31_17405 [Chitinophagaceae bacterium]|nr:hypothetical protein [Chitinophagaceae bacterium]
MKLFLSLALLVIQLNVNGQEKNVIISKDRVEVIFNSKLDLDQVIKIKSDLSAKNIELKFLRLEFTEAGKLIGIKFTVDFKDGHKGGAANVKLNEDSRFGFYRDFVSLTDPFSAGNIEDE